MPARSFAQNLVASRKNSPRLPSMLPSLLALYTPTKSSLGTLASYKRLHSYGRSTDLRCVNRALSTPGALSPSQANSPSLELARSSVKKSRIQRDLLFNQSKAVKDQKGSACVLDKLKVSALFWTEYCVKCFTDDEGYNYPKAECLKYTRAVVQKFRKGKLKGKLLKGSCYQCSLPISLCDKQLDSKTRDTLNCLDKLVDCIFPYAIFDMQACLQEFSDTVQSAQLERIRAKTSDVSFNSLDATDDTQFAKYFLGTVPMPRSKPISRISYDVNQITQVYLTQHGIGPEGTQLGGVTDKQLAGGGEAK